MDILLSPLAMEIVSVMAMTFVITVCGLFTAYAVKLIIEGFKETQEEKRQQELWKAPKWFEIR